MIVDEIALNFPNDLVLDLPSPIARIEQLSISIERHAMPPFRSQAPTFWGRAGTLGKRQLGLQRWISARQQLDCLYGRIVQAV
jgi:hypothetical protein